MTPDPASLNLAVTMTGLSNGEAVTVVSNLPAGSTARVDVIVPSSGPPKRFTIAAEGLSAQGAKDLTNVLFLHLQRVAEGGAR